MTLARPTRAAVLGSPIGHSLSPVLHRAAYAALGLDWQYDAVECTGPELTGFVGGLGPEWRGLSLTMPLKQVVLPLLDEADDLVELVGAANTVVLDNGRLHGSNTDVPGLVAALADAEVLEVGSAVVVGAGSTARSAIAAVSRLGCRDVVVVARRPEAALDLADLAARLGIGLDAVAMSAAAPAFASADLVVSTVPAGAADDLAVHVPARPGTLFDVVYEPWPTVLAQGWHGNGGRVVGGLDLLVHQAALQVELMTGQSAPLEAMRASLVAARP